jgi:hypothetical protein
VGALFIRNLFLQAKWLPALLPGCFATFERKVCCKRTERWRNQHWFIHHDKALAFTALSVQQFLVAKKMAVVPHPPYLPDLVPFFPSYFQE